MARVKRAVSAHKKKRKIFKRTKGFEGLSRSSYKKAKEAVLKAEKYAYRDRRTKKRVMRSLWNIRINAASRRNGLSYSKFMGLLKVKNIRLDRKILAQIAAETPEVFAKIVIKAKEKVKK